MTPRHIHLPCFGMVVTLEEPSPGSITSDLHAKDLDKHSDPLGASECGAAISGVETLVLACARSGVDIQHPKFVCAIETAVDAVFNPPPSKRD